MARPRKHKSEEERARAHAESQRTDVSGMRFNAVPAPGTPPSDGILLRTAMWEPLEESAYRRLSDEFAETRPVAPRVWYFPALMGEQTFLTLLRGQRTCNAVAIMGMSAQETNITHPEEALLAGRWFSPGDLYAMIVPKEIADALSVTLEAVEAGNATARYGGIDYDIIGVIDNDNFKAIKDLDQEPLTPVDFPLMQEQSQQGGGGGTDAGVREYSHLEPNMIFILPSETLLNRCAEVRSIAITFLSGPEVQRVWQALMPHLGLNLYAGEQGQTYLYSSIVSRRKRRRA